MTAPGVHFSIKGAVVMGTRAIAVRFGKKHSHILRDVKGLLDALSDAEFARANFQLDGYIDSRGRWQPEYQLTRDGLGLLVLRFTGKKVLETQVAVIKSFNALASNAPRADATKDAAEPSVELAREVRIGFMRQGTSLTAWVRENGIRIGDARMALIGVWNGPKGRALRERIVCASTTTMPGKPPLFVTEAVEKTP